MKQKCKICNQEMIELFSSWQCDNSQCGKQSTQPVRIGWGLYHEGCLPFDPVLTGMQSDCFINDPIIEINLNHTISNIVWNNLQLIDYCNHKQYFVKVLGIISVTTSSISKLQLGIINSSDYNP